MYSYIRRRNYDVNLQVYMLLHHNNNYVHVSIPLSTPGPSHDHYCQLQLSKLRSTGFTNTCIFIVFHWLEGIFRFYRAVGLGSPPRRAGTRRCPSHGIGLLRRCTPGTQRPPPSCSPTSMATDMMIAVTHDVYNIISYQ